MSRAESGRAEIVSIVGARPQFIKLAPVAAAFKKAGLRHVIIHTGQHYDLEMSARFFTELALPKPDLNLGIKGGGQARPTARMLAALARVFEERRPAWAVVYGDTTSTLAGSLAGAQSGLRVAHVEAGLRSFDRTQPEERNRVIANHVSDLLFAPTGTAVANLRREGITQGVHRVGDPMHEALVAHYRIALGRPLCTDEKTFLFCTVHRAENTDDPKRLRALVDLLAGLSSPVVLPLHPRTRRALRENGLWKRVAGLGHVMLHEPFGYLDTLRHLGAASAVLTDSGGVQREAAWLGTYCLTLRPVTEWVETVEQGRNVLVDLDLRRARAALRRAPRQRPHTRGPQPASAAIARILSEALREA